MKQINKEQITTIQPHHVWIGEDNMARIFRIFKMLEKEKDVFTKL